jgi:hypothetical protein
MTLPFPSEEAVSELQLRRNDFAMVGRNAPEF